MRVALIGCTVNPRTGGMGRALYDHATALAEAGQEVAVYTLPPFPIPPLAPPYKGGEIGFPFTIYPVHSLLHIGKAAWGARFDPPLDEYDVVHLHLPFFGVAERVARWRMSLRGVTPRDDEAIPGPFEIASSFAGLTPRNDKKRFLVTYHMDAIGTGLKRVYFNWWYRHRFKKVLAACDAIAVTSRAYARDSWLARAGIDVEKCEEILLRVDTGRFDSSLRGVSEASDEAIPLHNGIASGSEVLRNPRNDYLLFVGALDRAHYFKGLSLLLRAFASLDSRFRGDDRGEVASGMTEGAGAGMTELPRLVVVGAGELLEHYKKEAMALGIANRVHFTGGVTDEELARWYAGARALVLPSTDRSEAFGIVLIEAMACGTPVIASDLPGVREVVQRASGGVLVPLGIASSPGAPRNDNLIAALQQMWQHPWPAEDRAALAERVVAIYGRATLADQLLQWYNGVHVPSR